MYCTRTSTAFLEAVEPLLNAGEMSEARERLRETCFPDHLIELTADNDPRLRRLAVSALGLIGDAEHEPELLALLQSEDPQTRDAAEDALWRLWMRAADDAAAEQLLIAIRAAGSGRPESALSLLDTLCLMLPSFAEAHHQRGLVLQQLGRLGEAFEAYSRAVEQNPKHFAAHAALGHICVDREEFAAALAFYEAALAIHPHFGEVAEMTTRIKTVLRQARRAS